MDTPLRPGEIRKNRFGKYTAANKRGETHDFPDYASASSFSLSEETIKEGAGDPVAPNPAGGDTPPGYDNSMTYNVGSPTGDDEDGGQLLDVLEAIAIGAAEIYDALVGAEDDADVPSGTEQLTQALQAIKNLHDEVGPDNESEGAEDDEQESQPKGKESDDDKGKPSAFKEATRVARHDGEPDPDFQGWDLPTKKVKRLQVAPKGSVRNFIPFDSAPDDEHSADAPFRRRAPMAEDIGMMHHLAAAAPFVAGVAGHWAMEKGMSHVHQKVSGAIKGAIEKRKKARIYKNAANDNVTEATKPKKAKAKKTCFRDLYSGLANKYGAAGGATTGMQKPQKKVK